MNAITYVVSALTDPHLCLFAANALRDLCDANRIALAPHVSAFGELHAGLTGIPVCPHAPHELRTISSDASLQDTEKAKVLQSIASVIQALPPVESIPAVEVSRSTRSRDECSRFDSDAGNREPCRGKTLRGAAISKSSDSLSNLLMTIVN